MIEQNILDWIELGDSIQKMDLYKKNLSIFQLFYHISQQSHFSLYIYCFINFMSFAQIFCLNLYVLNDVKGDLILEVIDYFKNIFLIEDLIKNPKTFTILLSLSVCIFILSVLLLVINLILLKRNIKIRLLLATNGILNILNLYYFNGPNMEIIFNSIKCFKGNENNFEVCSFKETKNIVILIICIIYALLIVVNFSFISLYINDIGCINGTNVNCRITSNFTIIMVLVKLIYFIFHFAIDTFIGEDNNTVNLIYHTCFLFFNIVMSIYALNSLFYYDHNLNNWVHCGWYFSAWFSICIFFKSLLKIRVVSLAVICGVILISLGLYFHHYYSVFNLVTKFNIFEANNLKDIEKYNNLLLFLLRSNEHNDKILLLGVIERFEEYISSNPEINEQYQKLINDKHLQKKFSSNNELTVLSIIDIVYSYNIEKSKDIADLTFSMCYFLVNTCKNPTYAIWLCTKIKEKTHIQSYYKYALMEEIKYYLLSNLTKNKNKLSLRHVQISSVILYNQYIDMFKMKIYDATCSQIEYFDLLKNTTTTAKTTKNFLKIGEDILNLRKDILNLFDKIIILNPFNTESQKDYMIYIEIILQDDALMRSEEKKYNKIKTEKLSERNNIYYSMFIRDFSSILISDGYSYNGKILYTSPNFPSMFLFAGKEVLNYTIDDLLPDVVQSFHKYLIEDAIKFSNLSYIFKNQRNVLLKGKNGLLFCINLFVKPSPNLSYGLVYFSNIQKTPEQNVILILDENLIINGFTGIIQTGSNFTLNNNYGLTYGINGHHIGLIIPEVLLQVNYDQNKNIFTLNQNGIDLKGNLYPLISFQDLDKTIKKMLEMIKSRKTAEIGTEAKSAFSQEYNNLVKNLNAICPKYHSIFFKIEAHSFLRGKYHYYRIYIINDLFSSNEDDTNSIINTDINIPSNNDKSIKSEKKKDLSNTVLSKFSKMKQKTLNESAFDSKILKESLDLNNNNSGIEKKAEKFIRLKTEERNYNEIKGENLENKNKGIKGIHLLDSDYNKNDKRNNNKDNKNMDSSENNNNNVNNLDMILDLSRASSPSSILTQSSTDSVELNKIKNEITNKTDSFYVKVMKCLIYIFSIIVLILIIIEFAQVSMTINKMIKFLKENVYFIRAKIDTAGVYSSYNGFKFIKYEYVPDNACEIPCSLSYKALIIKSLNDIESQKSNIYLFEQDFLNIINIKKNITIHPQNLDEINYLNLDLVNWLNIIIANSMKIYHNYDTFLKMKDEKQFYKLYTSYLHNTMENSYEFFNSTYTSFFGEEKEKRCDKITGNSPVKIIFLSALATIILSVIGYYVVKINNIETFYLERLINFNSNNFEEYLKRLDELKKKFRDDNNEEEDKNADEADNKDELEINEDNNSGKKEGKKALEAMKNMANKNPKKKKSKQNKLFLKRLEKKKIMSKYFYKVNCFFMIKVGIIIFASIQYFIISTLVESKVKSNYYKFDSIIEEINNIYYQSYDIFLRIKIGIDDFVENNTKIIVLPKDSDIVKPKFGNVLMELTNNKKYSNNTLAKFSILYNGDACSLISEGKENELCKKIFSSILQRGIEQAVVQMGIVITSCLDELNSIKTTEDLKDLFSKSESLISYEAFMSKFFLNAFWVTQDIIDEFRSDEKEYIFRIINILLVVFMAFDLILFTSLVYFIYSYVNVLNSFLNFIGILPSKFISDDESLYQNIIQLQEFY